LFPLAVEAAEAGDVFAGEILTQAGMELARLAETVLRRLWPGRQEQVRIGISGGVFRHSGLVRRAFHNRLRAAQPHVAVSFKVVEPAQGALALARRAVLERVDKAER
jgi:N-acetylglucosamine kinase-like BadF-type ATPase